MTDRPNDRPDGKVIPFPARPDSIDELEQAWEKELSAMSAEQSGDNDYRLTVPLAQRYGLVAFIEDMSLGHMVKQKHGKTKGVFSTDRVMVFRLLVMAAIDLGAGFSVIITPKK